MRSRFGTPFLRSSAALAAIALAVVLAAPTAAGQTLVKPGRQAEAMDLQRLLPPLQPVPWLDARSSAAKPNLARPGADAVSALLLRPEPATSWPSGSRPASIGRDLARM